MSDTTIPRPIIYREYILNDLPITVNSEYKVFDFILGFASEDYNSKGEGTGHFHPTWNHVAHSPENVKKLKEKYPQLRVALSIGGAGSEYPFNPVDNELWIPAAVKSIKEILHRYHNLFDGIDIHYDVIKTSPEEFFRSIGAVIKNLKNDPHLTIKVVSVAPNEHTRVHYRKLVSEYHNYIDFVDYLFISDKYPTIDFVEFYKELVAEYKPVLVLPGYLSPLLGNKAQDDVIYLVKHKIAPGFFTYPSGHDALVGPYPFSSEEDGSKDI